jgi:hypothetical protein
MKTFERLVQIKKHWGFLAGRDALDALVYVRSAGRGWTQKDFEALTAYQLGRPTHVRFEVVAGAPIPPAQVSASRVAWAANLRNMRKRIKQAKAARLRSGKTYTGRIENTGVNEGV